MDTPVLAGEKASYLEQTMLAYKSGARHNDIYRRMRLIVQQLSDDEIRQLARYYAGLER
jgi:cytochrome c553